MMRARVAYAGAIHDAAPAREGRPDHEDVRLADGRVVTEDAVVWLAPKAISSPSMEIAQGQPA